MALYLTHIAPLPGDPLNLANIGWANPIGPNLPNGMGAAVTAAINAGIGAGASRIDFVAEKLQGRIGYGVLLITAPAAKKTAVFNAIAAGLVAWLQISPLQSSVTDSWPGGPVAW